jgi:hypothetical protein
MTRMELRRYAMLGRVRDFGQAHRDLFPESSVGGQAFATVAAAVAELSDYAVAKMSSAREGIRAKTEARHGLIERLEAIARTAHAIAVDRPGFDDSFRLPRQHSDEALVTIARVFIQDAEATKDQFVAHGLADTFVAELQKRLETFEQAARDREVGRSARIAAHAGIERALLAGLAAVRKLDVIVANHLQHDSTAIAVWEGERRLDSTRRPKATTPPIKPAPVPQGPEPPAAASLPAADLTQRIAS